MEKLNNETLDAIKKQEITTEDVNTLFAISVIDCGHLEKLALAFSYGKLCGKEAIVSE